MRRVLILLLVLLMLPACAAPAEVEEKEPSAPPLQEAPEKPAPVEVSPEEEVPVEEVPSEDHVLLTLDAPLADGRTLRLEAVGKRVDEYSVGVREVRVYDGEDLIQTVLAREANMAFWGDSDLLPGESVSEYTQCWNEEDSMTAADMNFDGNTDLGLFAFSPNNTIPFYFWTWDPEAEQYRYAFTLQGAEAHPETKELTAEYKDGPAGSRYVTEVYKPDETGELLLDRVEVETWESTGDSGRPGFEIWAPYEEAGPIRPGGPGLNLEEDFHYFHVEYPVAEVREDGTVFRYTEILDWNQEYGELVLTSREEYTDENCQ